MTYNFSTEEINEERHMVALEELEDTVYHVESITGGGKHFTLVGKVMVDGEMFHDFPLEIELVDDLPQPTAVAVMEAEWEWFDFIVKTN